MYDKRIKIFISVIAFLLLVCLLRLAQMQLQPGSFYQDKITELKRRRGLSRQFKTIRGRILDRNGKILAGDEPRFQLCISYKISSFMDKRVRRAKLLRAARKHNPPIALSGVQKELEAGFDDLQQVIEKCTYFGLEHPEVVSRIKKINDRIWNLRTFLAWVRNGPAPNILEKYNHKINSVPLSEAIADFRKKFPDEDHRLFLISKVKDIADMDKSWPLLQLKSNDDIFAAQLEFADINGVQVLPKARRTYPYGSVAAQTIGWVGPAGERDKELFEDDKLSSYLGGEVCGRDGVEYLCEAVLRGRRGRVIYDIDHRLISETKARFGKDVSLTLDIELQKKIEDYLADCALNPNCRAPTAAVVIDVPTGDILALVSTPVFDLNRIRSDYTAVSNDPNEPLRNRAINKQYPPGSVIKPLILTAGLESGKITPDEVIHCPAHKAPRGWPNCWIYSKYPWMGHDDKGRNNARNAIKWSCNIYFSRLADRIEPNVLQRWLLKFGYGRKILKPALVVRETAYNRTLRQVSGIISSAHSNGTILPQERRWFGIGQGNLRVSPLQVANAMAVIARGGWYKSLRLFIPAVTANAPPAVIASAAKQSQTNVWKTPDTNSVALNISHQTLAVVRDGMSAVVNEPGGTAYKEFVNSGLAEQGVHVFGKTGSTQEPANAWFAGFAEDQAGRGISIAVVVEGGQHGSRDAAPLARDIIQFCITAGYIGRATVQNDSTSLVLQ